MLAIRIYSSHCCNVTQLEVGVNSPHVVIKQFRWLAKRKGKVKRKRTQRGCRKDRKGKDIHTGAE